MLRIADFRVLYENTFYHSRWLNIWHWFCGFSLKSRILIFYYLASHTDRSYPIIHRWTFCTSREQSITVYFCLASEAFHLAWGGILLSAFYSSNLSLCRKLFLMQNTLNLKNEKYSGYRWCMIIFYLAACYCPGISCGEKEIVTSPEQSTNE